VNVREAYERYLQACADLADAEGGLWLGKEGSRNSFRSGDMLRDARADKWSFGEGAYGPEFRVETGVRMRDSGWEPQIQRFDDGVVWVHDFDPDSAHVWVLDAAYEVPYDPEWAKADARDFNSTEEEIP